MILAGHSYGGMVITGVADRLAERIAQLVYLDAFIPLDGQSLYDVLIPEQRSEFQAQAEATGNGWRIPPMGLPPDTPDDYRDWINARRGPQPRLAFTQPVHLPNGVADRLPRAYVHCTLKPGRDMFARFAEETRRDSRWRFHALNSGHNLQYTAPHETAEILLGLL